MKIIITLLRLVFAIYLLVFAGAVVGGFAGLALVVLDLFEFDHVLWLMEAGAGLLVVWGFVATGDGSTVEYSYQPGETRHETYGPGEFKVHDLENLDDKEMVFMTIEFLNSANKPMSLPDKVRAAA